MAREEEKIPESLRDFYQKGTKASISAPPFLVERTMAAYREEQKRASLFKWGKYAAIASFAVLLLVLVPMLPGVKKLLSPSPVVLPDMTHAAIAPTSFSFDLSVKEREFVAFINKPIVIDMKIGKQDDARITQAEILLRGSVRFYSKAHPEVLKKSSVTVALNRENGEGVVPFVVYSRQSGTSSITIRFTDQKRETIMERDLKIDFVAPPPSSNEK